MSSSGTGIVLGAGGVLGAAWTTGALAALQQHTGLDPRAHDSGPRSSRRRLSKRGNAELRRMLYLAGLGASHSKVFAPLYSSLKARGLHATEALIILGRKLLRIAWAVWNSGQPFDSSRVSRRAPCAQT